MGRPTLNKLKLTPKETVKKITFNEQEIEVKQYISIQDKLNMITDVLDAEAAADQNKFYNPGKLSMFFALKVLDYYTNISMTEKQKENFVKLYDDIISSGLYGEIVAAIPEDEIGFVYNTMIDTVEQIYKYQNSAYGILDAMNSDYSNLNFDLQQLMGNLKDKKDIELLNDVMTKLG